MAAVTPQLGDQSPAGEGPKREGDQGEDQGGQGEALGTSQREGQKHHVTSHVRHKHVPEDQITEGVDKPREERQRQ